MHISEGILSGTMLITGWAGTVTGISIGLKKIDNAKTVRTALISSAFFLASLVNVKIGPSSTHLSLLAPMGLVLGWSVFPAVFTALLLQALLFHFGGLLVLGANTFIMSSGALTAYIIFGKSIREGKYIMIMSFLAGAFAVMISAFMVGVFLGLTDGNFMTASKIIILAHIPLALIEGIVTAFMVIWLKRVSPEFIS